MSNIKQYLKRSQWRLLDRTEVDQQSNALTSFAVEDTLCTYVGQHQDAPTVHVWVHPNTVVLGQMDTRLTNFQQGVAYLRRAGYDVKLRNSGGAAVVLDSGVLNLSLIMPTTGALNAINHGYELLYQLLKEILTPLGRCIDAGEIVGSYCPGNYDLSIEGRKFTGIAQRRRRGAVAVQAFLNVTGSGSQRAELIKGFYEKAAANEDQSSFPQVVPAVTASLSELIQQNLSPDWIIERVKRVMNTYSTRQMIMRNTLSSNTLDEYERNLQQLIKRNHQYDLM